MGAIEKIGIFKGRESIYNKLILKTLFLEGPLTSWNLARKVYERMTNTDSLPKNWKGMNWYPITQKIYSVFIRENGRLSDLQNKGYLLKRNEDNSYSWVLSSKGNIATLILDKTLLEKKSTEEWNKSIEIITQKWKETLGSQQVEISLFGQRFKINLGVFGDFLEDFFKRFTSKEGLLRLIARVEEAIEKGELNLNAVNEQDLVFLFGTNKHMISFIEERFNAERVIGP